MTQKIASQPFRFLLSVCCTLALLTSCEKDVEPVGVMNTVSIEDYISDLETTADTGQSTLLFTASDSASLRKGKPAHYIQGFLPQYRVPEQTAVTLFIAPRQNNSDTLNNERFEFLDAAQINNGIFILSPEFMPGDFWVKAVIHTGDSLHFSNPARLTLSTVQTDFLSDDEIIVSKDNLNRTVINTDHYPTQSAVLKVRDGSNHLLSLFTRQSRFVLFSRADFEYHSNPEVNNPSFSPGNYTLDLFLLDENHRAAGRFITTYEVE